MPAFILRIKDDDAVSLWTAFKARVAQEGRSQRWVILELIKRYVDRGLD